MAFAFVNASSVEDFTGASVTTQVTPGASLTAGNLAIVTCRSVTINPTASDVTISDTAGNSYRFDGTVEVAHGLGFTIYSCVNCLGHAANAVTVTFPASAFVSVSAMQFSGTLASTRIDRLTTGYAASGAAISCVPTATVKNQIVIAMSDVGGSRTSTAITPGATFTLVYSSRSAPGIGTGSHDVWYNLNTARTFEGTVICTATYTGNSADVRTIGVAIYGFPIDNGLARSLSPVEDYPSGRSVPALKPVQPY